MALQDDEQTHNHPLNDFLFCEELHHDHDHDHDHDLDLVEEPETHLGNANAFAFDAVKDPPFPWEEEEEGCDDLLDSLISKQAQTHPSYESLLSDGPLMAVRRQAVDWILRVHSHYGFSALTAVVAVNYFDRFLVSVRFQRDKPWLGQLVAIACLSLAAKVEETHLPLQLLLHLQVDESVYLFEPKTIQRMELLVLSTLNWRMNPVTPLAFFDNIIRKMPFRLRATSDWDFFWMCEQLILSVLTDVKLLSHLPSTIAAAAMLFVVKEADPFELEAFQDLITSILKINKGKVDQCYELLAGSSGSHFCSLKNGHKRRKLSVPSSPSGVIDVSFSCESSNDSWAVASSVSSSPEPNLKRSRSQDHHSQAGLPLSSLRTFLQGCSR